jgi:hypothetical protein
MNGLPGSPVTEGGGSYSVIVDYDWSGTVTPTRTGYTFLPVSITYSNVASDQINQNYLAILNTYPISGTAGIDGVVMAGLPGDPVVSGSGGSYSVSVDYGWSGTVTPTRFGYTFTPTSMSYVNVISEYLDQDYTVKIDTDAPIAYDVSTSTHVDVPILIELQAVDGGLPYPVSYIIASLPTYGTLSDPGAGLITSAGYVLAGYGNLVVYTPDTGFGGSDSFSFIGDDGGTPPDGGLSNEANVSIGVVKYFITELFDWDNNDLGNQTFTFIPDGSSHFYLVCQDDAAVFPTEPNGVVLALGDDDYIQLGIADGNEISFYNNSYNSFWVSSNGYITFGSGDDNSDEMLAGHFNMNRISALFDDLDPGAGGTISWQKFDDRVVVTFENVPEQGVVNSNSFQIEMFYRGTICLTYLEIDATDGLAGLSMGGGVPSGFMQTDLTYLGPCADFNVDHQVDMSDLAILAKYWQYGGCLDSMWCEGADLNRSGDVDSLDINHFVQYWLEKETGLTVIEDEVTFLSTADDNKDGFADDGRVWGDENSGIGVNSRDSDGGALLLGSREFPPKYGGYGLVLAFDTSTLPSDGTVLSARLELTRSDVKIGQDDPFSWGGGCLIDIATPYFGASSGLVASDWDASADAVNVADFLGGDPGPDNKIVSTMFNSDGVNNIGLDDITQIRVRLANIYNGEDNYIGFYSGEDIDPNNHPKLTIRYSLEVDISPPEPDPMMWELEPNAVSPYMITMRAATASDYNLVEYYFNNVTDPSRDSGWIDSPVYVDAALDPDMTYTYRVKARDKSINQNETWWSNDVPATTPPGNPLVEQALIGDASEDGRVWGDEDGGTNANSSDSTGGALLLGCFQAYTQVYGFVVAFDTSQLPANITIQSAKLEVTRGIIRPMVDPDDPFSWGGECYIDIASPYFGLGSSLVKDDWDAPADSSHIASFSGPDPGAENTMVSTMFNFDGRGNINLDGMTQMRVRFENLYSTENNYLGFYSGATSGKEPRLIIQYSTE